MSSARYLVGDVFDNLATLPDNSVDLVMSSPPFLALRSYLPADHPDKHREIGSEPTPADFLDTLLDVVEACDRVLAPHGSLVFELGDTYAGSGGAGGDYNEGGLRDGAPKFRGSAHKANTTRYKDGIKDGGRVDAGPSDLQIRNSGGRGWPLDKSLCGIPTLFAWSLAYGRNLLRPERTTPPWRVRNVVAWARPNPPVGALGDKFRPATSYLTVACKARDRYFDLDAVREPFRGVNAVSQAGGYNNSAAKEAKSEAAHGAARYREGVQPYGNPAGAPPLDYWVIPTQPYAGSHYATFPMDLCVRPIKAMCPLKVCRTCGEPSRRIVEATRPNHAKTGAPGRLNEARAGGVRLAAGGAEMQTAYETIGWTDCGHDDWRTGVVLDCFAGSGTTLSVATGHGRDAIGIDLDARNAELALERVGPMLLSVEYPERAA